MSASFSKPARRELRARRATTDDLPQLVALWQAERLDVAVLEKRFTEFQVVEHAGEVLAAVGLHVSGTHGQLHGEAILRPEVGDELRQMMWDRLQVVARNHSLDRIWTRLTAPFWRGIGFRAAEDEDLSAMPEGFGDRRDGWQLLMLRSADASADAIEKQFAMMKALHAQEAEQLQRKVSAMKKLAIAMTVLVSALVIAWAVMIFSYGPKLLNR